MSVYAELLVFIIYTIMVIVMTIAFYSERLESEKNQSDYQKYKEEFKHKYENRINRS
jgi:membrane protein implicated in regulation of membrane protease activity